MPEIAIEDYDSAFLRDAANYLENPSFLMRVANVVGKPLEEIAGLAGRLVPARVAVVANAALKRTMRLAVGTIWAGHPKERRLRAAYAAAGWTGLWHQLATVGTGFGGGFFGLPALAVELPVTTGILFRSIAAIADDFGEDLRDPAVRLDCLSVFSHGGTGRGEEAMESSYLTARLAMATLVEDAARFVARESAEAVADAMARGAAPALLDFLARVAVRFNLAVSEKFLAQGLPVFGALGGAAINAAFADHFNAVARYHFGIRNLGRRLGPDAVAVLYRAEVDRLRKAAVPGRTDVVAGVQAGSLTPGGDG